MFPRGGVLENMSCVGITLTFLKIKYIVPFQFISVEKSRLLFLAFCHLKRSRIMDEKTVQLVALLIELGLAVLIIAGIWKVFVKAGEPGWACIIPIYNIIVLLRIVDKPLWWIILFFIPCVGVIFTFIVMIALAEAFGKGVLFGIGLALLGFIFFPILGFGDAEYGGRGAEPQGFPVLPPRKAVMTPRAVCK